MTDEAIWSLIVGKVLDWPVLLFILILILMKTSGQSISELFKNRKVDVELGGNKISIGDAVQALDEETKQALDDFRKNQEDIHSLKSRIDVIEKQNATKREHQTEPSPLKEFGFTIGKRFKPPETLHSDSAEAATEFEQPNVSVPLPDDDTQSQELTKHNQREAAFKRMLVALADSRFRWRSVERLAIESGITEKEAHDILAEHRNEVVLGKGKSGRTIARLPDR